MAFETGSATGIDDLLAKLKTFLESDGWTVNKYEADGTGYRLHVEKTGVYANLRTASGETLTSWYVHGIALMGSTGFDAGQSWKTQPGYPANSTYARLIDESAAIPNYWFFSNGTQVDVVAEVATGVYGSLHWGELVKCGTYAGGQYFSGTSGGGGTTRRPPFHKYCTYAYAAEVGGWVGYQVLDYLWAPLGDYVPGTDSSLGTLIDVGQTIGGVSPLLALFFAINGGGYQPLGWPEHVRVIRMDYLDVGEEIPLGNDTWKVLPVKGHTTSLYGLTGQLGLAIRKTA